ncbi:MAG: 2-amino-4-hydroxy-6-hydroxymethyldihydropteridine diphosphokinase [Spirochaetales bacterium]
METIWLGLGSNIGDKAATIRLAVGMLAEFIHDLRLSGLWLSKARYVLDQPDFLNGVVSGSTELSPQELLVAVNRIEASLGRDRGAVAPKGPRTIDIDILLYGDRIISDDTLIIPHPGMRERKFVLLPLFQLAPDLIDPVSGRAFQEFLAELPPQGIYPERSSLYDAAYP